MPRASTGIVLRQHHKTGRWTLDRPGQLATNFDADQTLNTICTRMGLDAGYWLRAAPETSVFDGQVRAVATVWTWVEL